MGVAENDIHSIFFARNEINGVTLSLYDRHKEQRFLLVFEHRHQHHFHDNSTDQDGTVNGNKDIIVLKLLGLENVWRCVGRVFATKEGRKGNVWAWYGEEQVMSDARPDNKNPMRITTCKAPGTVSDEGVSIF